MPQFKTKIGIIVQARIGSTRLPGKIMKPILGKPMLGYGIERLKNVTLAQGIVIATVDNKTNDPIALLASTLGVEVFRGSEEDVLSRYYEAARKFRFDVVVRITSDCPLIDPNIVNAVIQHFLDHQPVDYVSNTIQRTFPRGMDTEVFSFAALQQAHHKAKETQEREHVTPYILRHKKTLNYGQQQNQSPYRLTVDTQEDFELIKIIFEALYPKNNMFTLADIIIFLKEHPSLIEMNQHIRQRTVPYANPDSL